MYLAAARFEGAQKARLIAVAKTFPTQDAEQLMQAGHRIFGENRVLEAVEKFSPLRKNYDFELHLIGSLQTNKVKQAMQFFDVIQTLDRPKLAAKIADLRDQGVACPRLFIQVNTGEEPQKSGVLPGALADFIALCCGTYNLPVEGLMCIPPQNVPVQPHFAFLAKLAVRHSLPELSMGMSNDYEAAIEQGATYVRVGSALFGARNM